MTKGVKVGFNGYRVAIHLCIHRADFIAPADFDALAGKNNLIQKMGEFPDTEIAGIYYREDDTSHPTVEDFCKEIEVFLPNPDPDDESKRKILDAQIEIEEAFGKNSSEKKYARQSLRYIDWEHKFTESFKKKMLNKLREEGRKTPMIEDGALKTST